MTFSPEVRRSVYNCIVALGNFYGKYNEEDQSYGDLTIVDFLKLIWDLPTMKSEDPRYRNAEGDAVQHIINNYDWDTNDIFERRFNLLGGDDKYFVKFIEVVVSPTVRHNKQEITEYVKAINTTLEPAKYELVVEDYINGLPSYKVKKGLNHSQVNLFVDNNVIPFFIDDTPTEFPAFEVDQYTWDDYSRKTRYKLYYWSVDDNERKEIGIIKIMKKEQDVTYGNLPKKFYNLGSEWCSLGQSLDYYKNIKYYLGNSYRNVLSALRDAACFSQICDEFVDDPIFKISLLRERNADTALQFAQYTLAGFDYKADREFVYKTNMPYAPDNAVRVRFNFGRVYDRDNLNRIIAIIGNNGVGKTTLLSKLVESLVNRKETDFSPQMPVFSKVISASYSIFDKFYNIEGKSYNYIYCGLRASENTLLSEEQLAERRKKSSLLIKNNDVRGRILLNCMEKLMPKDIFEKLFDDTGNFREDEYLKIHERLSSGQNMLMNLIINIIGNIRPNTLLIIDEPEVHLHPRGITEFVALVDKICRDYYSCCIMATHSPIVIQELLSRNVIIMDRDIDGSPIVRPMRLESMGENLTTITQEIFGRDNNEPIFVKKIKRLVGKSSSREDIINSIQNNNVPISMPLYLLIDKYFTEKDDKS